MDSSNDKSCSNSQVLEDAQDIPDLTMSLSRIMISDNENSPPCVTIPPKSLNDLPDLCLFALFKYIPLIDLICNIRWVNPRMSLLVPIELNRRHSLVIVDYRNFELSDLQLDKYQSGLIEHVRRDDGLTPWSRLPPVDSLNLVNRNTRYSNNNNNNNVFHYQLHNQVSYKMITTLMNNLPRIHSLTVVQRFSDLSELYQIARMIDHWRDGLVSLKIYLNYEFFSSSSSLTPQELEIDGNRPFMAQLNAHLFALFNSINRATSLKHLKLKFENFCTECTSVEFTQLPMSILSQLSTFQLNAFNENLGDELVRYAPTNCDLEISTNLSLEFLLAVNPEFCDRFVGVKLVGFTNNSRMANDLTLFCIRFPFLVHLSINNQHDMPVTKLARCLTSLTQLVHLRMRLTARQIEGPQQREQQELPPDQIVPVPSVRLLTLHLIIRSHSATEPFHLHQVFPNVQVLSIESITVGCADCGFDFSRMSRSQYPENGPLLRECAQLARRPFRHFPRLHTIQIDVNDSVFLSDTFEKKLITKDEL